MLSDRIRISGKGDVAISAETADKLLSSGSGEAALLYIFLLRNGGECSSGAAKLKLDAASFETGMTVLKRLGLVQNAESTMPALSASVPEYSPSDIAREMERGPEFRGLVEETQRRLGKVLSSADLGILLSLYDQLGLPTEVLFLLITYCVEQAVRRYGEGRTPTMRQIEKEAQVWVHRELYTTELALAYLKKAEETRTKIGAIRQAIRIKNRELSPSEENYAASWVEMGFSADAIELAYDRTILNTGDLKWPYMNSILKKWHEKGLHTIKEIESGDTSEKKLKKAAAASQEGDYERNAMEWLKRYNKDDK